MKKLLTAIACTLPFTLGSMVYAQGTKGPSGSGAESASKQSRSDSQDDQDTTHSSTHDLGTDKQATDPAASVSKRGSQESTTPVAQRAPHTPRTTEPDAGKNRSSSGDSAGPDQRRNGTEGIR